MSSEKGLEDSRNNKIDSRSNRIICAKLYEGGLLHTYKTLRSITHNPFTGKSPEFELDIDLISRHAEVAFRRHVSFTLTVVVFSLLGFIFNLLYARSLFYESNFYLLAISLVFSVSAICILLMKPILDRNIAFKYFSRETYDRDYNLDKLSKNDYLNNLCRWLIEGDKDESKSKEQNIIVFGGYFPFIGSGVRIKNWNFVTSKLKDDSCKNNQSNLSVEDLYEVVKDEIEKKKLPVTTEYMLYVDGREIDKNEFLLDKSKPRTYIKDSSKFSQLMKEIFKDYRVYLLIRYHDEVRSTLLSTFLRVSTAGEDFFVECSSHILTPINENIYNIDKLPRNNYFALKTGLITLVLVLFYISGSLLPGFFPLILLVITCLPIIYILYLRVSKYKNIVNKFKGGKPYNYGIINTFRENIASPDYKSYFSAQDILMIQGSVEKSIINSTATSLDENGYDSSFLSKQIISFVNNGIMQSGGTINNSPVASGDGSIITQINEATQAAIHQFQQTIGSSKEAKT